MLERQNKCYNIIRNVMKLDTNLYNASGTKQQHFSINANTIGDKRN